MNNETILAQRFLSENPGSTLIAIDDCAIPAKVLLVSMVTLQRKPLSLLTEFILRGIDAGLENPDELSSFLGFPNDETVENRIAELAAEGVLHVAEDNRAVLTSIGRTRVKELIEIVPEVKPQEFLFDQCGWMLSSASPSEKMSKGKVDADGLIVLPAKSKSSIDDKLITTEAVIEAINMDLSKTRSLDILRIEGVIKKKNRVFIPGKILIYRSAGETTTRVAVAVNGVIQQHHERVVADKGGATALGIEIEDVRQTYEIDKTILDNVVSISQEQKLSHISGLSSEDSDLQSKTSIARQAYEIGTYEHWPLLMSAVTSSKERLFINSPWVSPLIVNDDFLTKFEACLKRGVIATIGYGFGAEDERESWSSSKRVIKDLEGLSLRYPNFSLIRHGNTHAKQLIFDQTCVIGSFNWLSFKGDKKKQYRQEKSFVVSLPGIADNSYAKAIEELVNQGVMKYWEETSHTKSKQHAVSVTKVAPGDVIDGIVVNAVNFGVFLELQPGIEGLLHISQTGCNSPEDLKVDFPKGSSVKIRVESISLDPNSGKMRYTLTRVFE